MRQKVELTQSLLRDVLSFDSETGLFRWRVARSNVSIGSIAGSVGNHGYMEIRFGGKLYLAHRLAWFYVHGEWPAQTIDHINGIRTDNRLVNLRAASYAENNRNCGLRSNNKSGFRGVSWHKQNQKWVAYIKAGGCSKYLGSFDKIEDASRAYGVVAVREFGRFCHKSIVA